MGVIEIEVKGVLAGKTIAQVNMPGELLVTAIIRMPGVVIPEPQTVLREKETLMAVVKVASLGKIKEKFGLGER